MAYSRVTYAGTGSVLNATFPFPYLDKTDIKVFVNDVEVPFTFLNTSTVTPTTTPTAGSVVQVRRITQKASVPVNFTDGSVLLEQDLDLLGTYSLYLAQETQDGVDSTLTVNFRDEMDAQSKRVVNVLAGVNPTDAVNKGQLDVPLAANLSAVQALRTETLGYKDSALASRNAAGLSADAARDYLAAYRATSYGALPGNPTVDPNGNPPTTGDEYFNTTSNLLFRFNGTNWQASDISTANLAAPGGSGLVGTKRAITGAAALTLAGWVESQTYCTADFAGIVSDGTGDNRLVLENIISSLPVGSSLRIKGILRIASTLTITKRINIICPGAEDAILVDVGTPNDGVVFSGTASGLNNIDLKLNVYGRANACRDALVLSRVDRSPNIDLNVYAGAVRYAINLKGMLINRIKVQSSANYLPPISNPGFQVKHIKVEKALGVAFNANELYVNLEGGGSGIEGDDMSSEGNNIISGTIEGLTSGRPIDLSGWLGTTVRDLHFEANALGPRFFNCSHLTFGPSVVNANSARPALFENCRQPFIDGYYGAYRFDLNCSFPRIGRVLAQAPEDLGTDSYFASSEVQGATASISTVDAFSAGPGSFTLENLFHNPFMDMWSNGYFVAPDGFELSNATCQTFTFPAPTYTAPEGRSCEVTVGASPTIAAGLIATCKPPYHKGQQAGHYMSVMVPIYVAAGQPDVIVFILSSGQFFNIGKVTAKDKWVEVRGGSRCSPGGDNVQIRVLPWDFAGNGALPGKFVVGGLSVVQGVRAPRHLCNHGKREAHIVNSIGNVPAFVGQRAFVTATAKWYMAGGTAAAADWLLLN